MQGQMWPHVAHCSLLQPQLHISHVARIMFEDEHLTSNSCSRRRTAQRDQSFCHRVWPVAGHHDPICPQLHLSQQLV